MKITYKLFLPAVIVLGAVAFSACAKPDSAASGQTSSEAVPFAAVEAYEQSNVLSSTVSGTAEGEASLSEQSIISSSLLSDTVENEFHNTISGREEELDTMIDKLSNSYGVLGCSVAAFEHDEIVYTYSCGTASPQRGTAAEDNTKYRIASISKVPTMMLAMMLLEQGKLNLSDDIADIVNEKLRNPSFPDDKATIERLMSHTSGIIDGGGYISAISNYLPFPPLDTVLKGNVFSGSRPGEECVYSNFGMGLISGAVEAASGEKFYDYAEEALFKPLGVDAAYITDYIDDKSAIASFYGTDPLSWGEMKPLYSSIPLGQMYLLGHGELYISAEDLAKIAIILAGDGTYNGTQYLKQETIDNIHTKRAYETETNATRGLTVQISDEIIEGTTLYGHQGNAYGAISCMFYEPETERGVVFLTNGASSSRAPSGVYAVNDAVVNLVWEYL